VTTGPPTKSLADRLPPRLARQALGARTLDGKERDGHFDYPRFVHYRRYRKNCIFLPLIIDPAVTRLDRPRSASVKRFTDTQPASIFSNVVDMT
jgi:hypothetical protein